MLSKNTKPKRKKCKQCGKPFQPCLTTATTCSYQCAIEYTSDPDNRKKVIEKAQKDDRKETKAKLRRLGKSDRSKALRAAQKAFNAFIRERDKDLPCICCGRFTNDKGLVKGSRWDAGHYRSTGSAPHLRFNEDNCHKQMVFCNRNLSGNVADYRIGLIARIGQDRVDAIETNNKTVKYSVDDLWEIESYYKEKIKSLKSN